jgi:hypothetical protein
MEKEGVRMPREIGTSFAPRNGDPLQLFRGTEVLFVDGDASAVFADEFPVLHELFVVFEVGLHVPHVLKQAQVLLMPRMGHLYFGHETSPPLRVMTLIYPGGRNQANGVNCVFSPGENITRQEFSYPGGTAAKKIYSPGPIVLSIFFGIMNA